MNRLAPWLLAVLAMAGCAKSTAKPPAKMLGPQGVAVYRGFGADQPGVLRPLVAVANTRGDDLRIIDAVTDKVLVGPTLVAALAVPTEPRPSLIAAGSLGDRDPAGTSVLKSDLLVVAPRGQVQRPPPAAPGTLGAVIQLVVTWDDKTRIQATVDLGDLLPDATLTGLMVAPVMEQDTALAWQRKPNQAQVWATTTDGNLVSILARRDPADATNAIALDSPVVQALGFAGLDLALSKDATRIYVATLDPIPDPGGVLGVAELDNTAAPGNLPVRPISARLGTLQVAATDVAPFVNNTGDPELDEFGPAVPRVYAVLDPRGCGRDRSTPCGIAVIDPAAGTLAADPAGELPFQLPIEVSGEVADFAVSGPPENSSLPGYLKFDPGSGLRWTQSFAGVATSSGRIYLVDLSHFAVGNAVSPLLGSSATRVASSASFIASQGSAAIGIWYEPIGQPAVLEFDALAALGIAVTPGYTRSEAFTLTYQGKLPGLSSRRAVARVASGAPSWVAIQEATGLTGPGTSPWRSVARLYDPRLAVAVGDLVEVEGFPSGSCPEGRFELVVTALLPPDPALYPGGAVAVTEAQVQPPGANPSCLPQGADSPVTVTFLAQGMVLAGAASGYSGRPDIVTSPEDAPRFELKYEDEQALSCPIMADDPMDWPPAPADVAACQADVATCRSTCERLVLARRSRRGFYMTDGCPENTSSGATCTNLWVKTYRLAFPMPQGPVVAFKAGITPPDLAGPLERGSYLIFTTAAGFVPGSRGPTLGAAGSGTSPPHGVVIFDRSAATGVANDALHGYAAYSGDLVLDFAPWSNVAPATTIR